MPQMSEEEQPTSILRRSTRLHQKNQIKPQPAAKNPKIEKRRNKTHSLSTSTPNNKTLIPKPQQSLRKSTRLSATRRSKNENSNAQIAKTGKGMDNAFIRTTSIECSTKLGFPVKLEKRVTRSSIKGKTSVQLEKKIPRKSQNPSQSNTRSKGNRSIQCNSNEGRLKLGLVQDFSEQFTLKLRNRSRDCAEKSSLDLEKLGEREKKKDIHRGKKQIGLKRKRNQVEENNGISNGWNPNQEFALQRAYLATKPTPHFWKKVAKLVPGKSAQECFNKIHSDHLTPPQIQPRTRARTNSSSSLSFSLSPSDLLKSPVLNVKNKRKSLISHKNVRQLLHKSYKVDPNYETDLFSALESTSNPTPVLFTPDKKLQSPQSLLKNCQQKEISRFGKEGIMSPPVLKQVKNRVLHDRYIDRLRSREAKRKSVYSRAVKCSKKEDKIDAVKAAKNALVFEARDAINQFRDIQADAMNSIFLDEDEDKDED